MNNIIKRENGREPANFGSVVDQIFQNNLNRFFDDEYWGFNGLTKPQHQLKIPVNILENDKSYEMELFAPGFKKQDFKLNLEGETFTVSGEQALENKTEGKNEDWVRQEYKKQAFSRSFNLDDTVDTGKIAARYEDGILYLSFPKKEHAQKISRSINVQ